MHGRGRVTPGRRLFGADTERPRLFRVPAHRIGGAEQVSLRHQIGVDVVVGQRGVCVGPRHSVDVETTMTVMVAQREPQPGRLDQQLEPDGGREPVVARGVDVPHDRVGDVRADVKRRGARRPVRRALVATNGAPGEHRAGQVERARAVAGEVDRGVPPAQRITSRRRHGIGEHGKHEHLRVPKRVPVVPRPSQSLGANRPLLRPRPRLEHLKESEPHRLLEFWIAVQFDIGGVPERGKVLPLGPQQIVPAGVTRANDGRVDLIAKGGPGTLTGPSVSDKLDDP